MSTKLIHDITPARDNWERYYAKMEYDRIKWHDLWRYCEYIPIKLKGPSLYVCMSCGQINDWFVHSCYECEAEGERQHESV